MRTALCEHSADRQHKSGDVLYFRTDNQVTGCYFPATCEQFVAKPSQWLLVVSSITPSASRAPALLKYILISLRCGSFIVEMIIPRWGWQQRRRRSALTPLQFPPHLISTWLHSTRDWERAAKMKKGSHPPDGNGHSETGPGKWAVPQRSLIGVGGIKRALRCYSKGY